MRGKMRGVKSWQKSRVQPLEGVRPGLTEAALGGETLAGESARMGLDRMGEKGRGLSDLGFLTWLLGKMGH